VTKKGEKKRKVNDQRNVELRPEACHIEHGQKGGRRQQAPREKGGTRRAVCFWSDKQVAWTSWR